MGFPGEQHFKKCGYAYRCRIKCILCDSSRKGSVGAEFGCSGLTTSPRHPMPSLTPALVTPFLHLVWTIRIMLGTSCYSKSPENPPSNFLDLRWPWEPQTCSSCHAGQGPPYAQHFPSSCAHTSEQNKVPSTWPSVPQRRGRKPVIQTSELCKMPAGEKGVGENKADEEVRKCWVRGWTFYTRALS